MSDTNHRTSVFLGLKDNMSPGLRRITGEVNTTASAFARLASKAGGGLGGGLTAGLRGIAGVAGLATRGLLGLAKTAGGIVVGGLRAAANVARTTIGIFSGLVRTGLALTATLGGLTAAGIFKGLQAGGGREAQFKSLVNIEGGARRAMKSMADLKRIARQPGIGFDEAIQGYSGLRAVRAPAPLAKGLIAETGNAVALNGGGPEDLKNVLRGVGQTFGKGKIQAEELMQILEPAPMLRQAIEGAFGTADPEKLTKMLEQRGLSVAQFWERVLVKMRQLPRAGDGAKNALENVGIAAKELTITFGQGFLGADGAKRISAVGSWLESLDPIAKRLGQNLRRIFDRVTDSAGRMTTEFKLAWRALQAGDTASLSKLPQWAALLAENIQRGANWLREMGARAAEAGRFVGKFVGDFATAWRAMNGGLVDADQFKGLDSRAVDAAGGLKRMVDQVKNIWGELKSGDWGSLGDMLARGLAKAYNVVEPWAVKLAVVMAEAGLKAVKGFISGLREEFPKLDEFLTTMEARWKEWSARIAGWIGWLKQQWQGLKDLWGKTRWGQAGGQDDAAPTSPSGAASRTAPAPQASGTPGLWDRYKANRYYRHHGQVPQERRGLWDWWKDSMRRAGELDPPSARQRPTAFGGQQVPLSSISAGGTVHTINVRVTTDREPSKADLDKFNRHMQDWVREVNG